MESTHHPECPVLISAHLLPHRLARLLCLRPQLFRFRLLRLVYIEVYDIPRYKSDDHERNGDCEIHLQGAELENFNIIPGCRIQVKVDYIGGHYGL
jgi:hypothetical protein